MNNQGDLLYVEAVTGCDGNERYLKLSGKWHGNKDIEACLKFGKEQVKVFKIQLGQIEVKQVFAYK